MFWSLATGARFGTAVTRVNARVAGVASVLVAASVAPTRNV
jgi:hypothetical protein